MITTNLKSQNEKGFVFTKVGGSYDQNGVLEVGLNSEGFHYTKALNLNFALGHEFKSSFGAGIMYNYAKGQDQFRIYNSMSFS